MKWLTEDEWRAVLDIQRRSKRYGGALAPDELRLVTCALRENPERYSRQAARAHDDVRPFGAMPSRSRA